MNVVRIKSLNLHSPEGRRELYEIASEERDKLNAYRASFGDEVYFVKNAKCELEMMLEWAETRGVRIKLEISPVTGRYELFPDGWYQFDDKEGERNDNRT